MEKKCTKCGCVKSLECFGKNIGTKDGKSSWCKECVKIRSRAYYAAHREQCIAASERCQYRLLSDPERHEKKKARQRVYSKDYIRRPETRLKAKKWWHNYQSKPRNRLLCRMSFQVWNSLRSHLDGGSRKMGRQWKDVVGYTVEEMMAHLESLFQPGMTWENYGKGGWHIDHIKPRSWFHFASESDPEFKECWALSNLQPKWAGENSSKGNRFEG